MLKHKQFYHIVHLFFIAFATLVIVLSLKSTIWKTDNKRQECTLIKTGWQITKYKSLDGTDIMNMHCTFSDEEAQKLPEKATLFFRSNNTRVRTYVDGILIYSFGYNGARYAGNESGPSVHFINLPHGEKKGFNIDIQFSPYFSYIHRQQVPPAVYVGVRESCIGEYFSSSLMPSGLLSFAIIIIGIISLFFTIVFRFMRHQFISDYYFWGMFSVFSGIGFLIESGFLNIIIPNSFLLYFLSTLMLAISPKYFLGYINKSKTLPYNENVSKFFAAASYIEFALICFFALVPIIPFSYVKIFVIIVLMAFIFFVIAITINEAVSFVGHLSFLSALLIITAVALITDLTLYIFPPYSSDAFLIARPVCFVCIVVRCICVINDFYNVQILTARKDMYEDTVSRDVLTGTRTRPAFWKAQKELSENYFKNQKDIYLVLFEIVNLKLINQKKGFSSGDFSLYSFASILQQNFSVKDVYRFDGSSFSILITKVASEEIDKKIEKVYSDLEYYNRTRIDDKIDICNSKNKFDRTIDENFDRFIVRSRVALYENRLKSQKKP